LVPIHINVWVLLQQRTQFNQPPSTRKTIYLLLNTLCIFQFGHGQEVGASLSRIPLSSLVLTFGLQYTPHRTRFNRFSLTHRLAASTSTNMSAYHMRLHFFVTYQTPLDCHQIFEEEDHKTQHKTGRGVVNSRWGQHRRVNYAAKMMRIIL
jgi:hypothetical protein